MVSQIIEIPAKVYRNVLFDMSKLYFFFYFTHTID